MKIIKAGQYSELVKKYRKVDPISLADHAQVKGANPKDYANKRLLEINVGLEPFQGNLTERQVAHLIKRISFGVTTAEINRYRSQSIDQILDRFLVPAANYPEPVNNYNNVGEGKIDLEVPEGESFVLAAFDEDIEGDRITSLKTWMIGRILNSQDTATEKMILFWWHFLPVKLWDVFISKMGYRYFKMLERNAFGNFRTLIRELTLDPAMLIFLSGAFNNRESPDENFARELQELFCVGRGEDSGYTEEDIRNTARVLTGWTIDWDSVHETGEPQSYFNPEAHHTGDKQFSSFYGNRQISGRAGEAGAEELDELLDMIFATQECSRHLARRMYAFFVTTEITDFAEINVIRPLANIIRQNNYDILPALRTLLKSAHFYHEHIIGVSIKNPFDFTLGFWKSFGMDLATNPQEEREMYQGVLWQMANIGMEVGDPPNVAGWPPYYQVPMFDKIWINTDTIARRIFLTDSLVYWGFRLSNRTVITADVTNFVEGLASPEDPNELINDAALILLGVNLGPIQFDQVKQVLLSGQEQDYYWTGAWLTYQADKNDREARTIVLNRLNPAFQILLQMAETHLM
jgi:uncharacterized protein (DUF1800 family)